MPIVVVGREFWESRKVQTGGIRVSRPYSRAHLEPWRPPKGDKRLVGGKWGVAEALRGLKG